MTSPKPITPSLSTVLFLAIEQGLLDIRPSTAGDTGLLQGVYTMDALPIDRIRKMSGVAQVHFHPIPGTVAVEDSNPDPTPTLYHLCSLLTLVAPTLQVRDLQLIGAGITMATLFGSSGSGLGVHTFDMRPSAVDQCLVSLAHTIAGYVLPLGRGLARAWLPEHHHWIWTSNDKL